MNYANAMNNVLKGKVVARIFPFEDQRRFKFVRIIDIKSSYINDDEQLKYKRILAVCTVTGNYQEYHPSQQDMLNKDWKVITEYIPLMNTKLEQEKLKKIFNEHVLKVDI